MPFGFPALLNPLFEEFWACNAVSPGMEWKLSDECSGSNYSSKISLLMFPFNKNYLVNV
jgi:hypothetical protein